MWRAAYNVTKATIRQITVESHIPSKMFLERAGASSVNHLNFGSPAKLPPCSPSSVTGGLLSPVSNKLDVSSFYEYRTWRDEDVNEVVDFIVNSFIRREVLMGAHSANEDNARSYIEYCIEVGLVAFVRTKFSLSRLSSS